MSRRLAHLRQLLPSHLQLYLEQGIATVANSVVAPTPTAHPHHAHAHATPTTTQVARYGRHPQSEGSNPGTRMQRQAITGY